MNDLINLMNILYRYENTVDLIKEKPVYDCLLIKSRILR